MLRGGWHATPSTSAWLQILALSLWLVWQWWRSQCDNCCRTSLGIFQLGKWEFLERMLKNQEEAAGTFDAGLRIHVASKNSPCHFCSENSEIPMQIQRKGTYTLSWWKTMITIVFKSNKTMIFFAHVHNYIFVIFAYCVSMFHVRKLCFQDWTIYWR